jgi:AcrR family transcriptional regulator
MVQKSKPGQSKGGPSKVGRGRPRAYDPDIALGQALGAFWGAGYAATSLDDLSAATGMNRPSLYAAFGDKRALYRATLARYRAIARAAVQAATAEDRPLRDTLRRLYDAALTIYFSGAGDPRGCFLIGTAVTEAALDPALRGLLLDSLREIDAAFEARLRLAQARGELARAAKPALLARLASALLYFLAVRSRAGEPRAALTATVEGALDLICSAPPTKARRARRVSAAGGSR